VSGKVCSYRSPHNLPGGTSRASSPSQAPPICHDPCFLPSLRCGPVSPAPPGAACGRSIGHERGAPVRPAPARHASTPLRFVPASRARPIVTGGDPAAPGRLPATPQPPHEPRQSLRLVPWRRVGASARVARPAAPVASLPAAGSARPGARGARALARQAGRGAARGHPNPGSTARRCGLKDASTAGAATLQLGTASAYAAPTVPALRAPGTPARKQLRSLRSLRVATLLAATARALRCAPSSLHSDREPPGLRCAPARCAPPHPARLKSPRCARR